MLALSLLPLSPAVLSVEAGRTVDRGLLGNVSVPDFEVNITGTATSKNTTLLIPIHKSAYVTSAALNVTGKPELSFVTLLGESNSWNDGEGWGDGIDGGDWNDDGYGDFALGWGGFSVFGAFEPGRVEVYYGGDSRIISGRQNWTSYSGTGIAGTGGALTHGDYNSDGIDDLVIGEGWAVFGGTPQRIFLYYGSSSGLPLNESMNLTMNPTVQTYFGRTVAGGIDVNGDGYDDLVAGEEGYNGGQGRVDVLWGGPDGLNVTNVTFLTWNSSTRFGERVKALGDTDGDGLGEFAVGAPQNGGQLGLVVVYEGIANSTSIAQRWSYAASVQEYAGYSLAGGLDITGDGIEDLGVGVPFKDSQGAVYIFNGTGGGNYSATPYATLPAMSGTAENLGIGLDFIRDFDGDGKTDLIAGGNRYSPAPATAPWDGRFYLYTAQNLTPASAVWFDNPNRTATEEMGWRVNAVPDLNGDGVDEFTVTVHNGANGTVRPGLVRLYYGSAHAFPENTTLYFGNTPVWSQAGTLRGNATAYGLGPALQAYINANQASANATGIIMVPLSVNFTNGGKLNLSNIAFTYTLVSPPPNIQVTSPPTGGQLTISWSLQATDGNLYSVWSNKSGTWAIIGNVSFPRTFFNDTNVSDGATYWYYVTEWDTSVPLQSAPSAIISGTPSDVLPPLLPAGFVLTKNATAHTIRLQWAPNGDDTIHYEVWRRAGDVGSLALHTIVTAPTSFYIDGGLTEEVNYTYEVRAVDDVGLMSNFTVQLTERLPDVTPPAVPLNFQAVTDASGTAAVLSWTPNTDDTAGYAVLRANSASGPFVEVDLASTSPFTTGGLTRSQNYWFKIQAVDRVLLRSLATNSIVVFTVDTQPPAAPLLTAAFTLAVGNTVQVNWTATGDDLAGFRVYTNASGVWAMVLQVGGNARFAAVSNLTDGQTAYFRVSALDLGALEGLQSNELSASPADTQRPAAATGLSATAPAAGASLLLVWTPPPDVDVVSYKVWFLDPTVSADYNLAATVTGPATYLHSGLKNGVTYRYQVTAMDEVGNEGPPSLATAASPKDTIPPSAPRITTASVTTNLVVFPVQGTSEPGMDIQLWVRGRQQSNFTADSTGNWSGEARLTGGDNEIYARAIDPSPIIEIGAKTSQNSAVLHISLDTTKPTASSTSPTSGATGVAPSAPVFFTFSETVRPESVTVVLTDSAGNTVEGTLTVDVANHTARFQPNAPLAAGASYTATATALDAAGNAMTPASVTFTTQGAGTTGGGGGFLPGFDGFLALAGLLATASIALTARARRRDR